MTLSARRSCSDVRLISALSSTLFCLIGAADAEPLRGPVLDVQTGRPIDQAVVVGPSGRSGVQEAVTDVEGRFELNPFPGEQDPVYIYKFGYILWSSQELIDPRYRPPRIERRHATDLPARILVERFPANGDHSAQPGLLIFMTKGSGQEHRLPRLWQAIQPEIQAGWDEKCPKLDGD